VALPLRERLGALGERDFRLLFTATTITTIGDRMGAIALAFAVLDLPGGTATDLGIVLGVRQGVNAAAVLAAGVVADRLPRNLVLTGASLVQGAAQAVTAALVLTGQASVASLVLLAALYGVGNAVVIPAEVGLVPQTVSPARLQQANALQGLSRNVVGVLGPAVGGVIVVAGSPGAALGVDALTFFACAALLAQINVPGRAERGPGFFRELREGWTEFTAHTWLWSTVLLFGIGNLMFTSLLVLGPLVSKEELGGAGAWATILTAGGVGSVLGGVVAMRIRPSRPLLVSCLAPAPMVLQPLLLAAAAPVWAISAASFLAGAGLSVHLTLWFTVFQREIPEQAQSRVSSYDALGSFILMPLGYAAAGPIAVAIGTDTTLVAAALIELVCLAIILAIPSVWAIRASAPGPAPPAAGSVELAATPTERSTS
jgi:predicted MFS family arabinose efflux permease